MNSMRWMFLAAALFCAPACKKDKTVESSPTPAPAEASKAAEEPGAAQPSGAGDNLAAATTGEAADQKLAAGDGSDKPGADLAQRIDDAKGKDMVAVGSSGKEKVIATAGKTVADTEAYTVKLAAPAKLSTGAKGSATLEIVPKAGWHLNDEFPYKLTMTAPSGAKVAKPEQGKKDTVAFSPDKMKWAIDFEASAAGDKAFTGKVKFAVCTETSCDPKKEELAFNVKVE